VVAGIPSQLGLALDHGEIRALLLEEVGRGVVNAVLVTGATGFLGSAVVEELVRRGVRVRTTGRREAPPGGLPDYRKADLRNPGEVARLMDGVDSVIHAAGLAHRHGGDGEFEEHNALATEHLTRAAASAKAFVLVSSVAVYGTSGRGARSEDQPCAPSNAYGRSKREAERRALAAAAPDQRVTILRMATIYGERDPGNCGRLMRSIDEGRFRWIGDGRNLKSLVYRADAARACVQALERTGPSGEAYNISGHPVTMRTVVDTYARALGRTPPSGAIPAWLALGAAGIAAGLFLNRGFPARAWQSIRTWLREDAVSAGKAARDLGFQATTSLEEGVRRQVEWYRKPGQG
jgi:nucleoside-diphosphate-sugar epimerase